MSLAVPVKAPSGSPLARSVGSTAAFRAASVIADAPAGSGSAVVAVVASGGAVVVAASGAAAAPGSGAGACARAIPACVRHDTSAATSTIFFVMVSSRYANGTCSPFRGLLSLPDPLLLIGGSQHAHDPDQTDRNPREHHDHSTSGTLGDAKAGKRSDKAGQRDGKSD